MGARAGLLLELLISTPTGIKAGAIARNRIPSVVEVRLAARLLAFAHAENPACASAGMPRRASCAAARWRLLRPSQSTQSGAVNRAACILSILPLTGNLVIRLHTCDKPPE
jgi:hypothetical protein